MAGILRVDQANVDVIGPKTAGGTISIPGHVIQVQSSVKTDAFSTNSTSYQAIGLSVTITPKFTNSKILVMVSIAAAMGGAGSWHGQLTRNASVVVQGDALGSRRRDSFGSSDTYGNDNTMCSVLNYLDSPGSTSTQTYAIQICAGDGNGTAHINRPDSDNDNSNGTRCVSTITVMEIAQ